ncbi:YhcH/YjgK/YiaL family protein [Gilliamella sp. B3172]|nr:YhcH/YjgK/YiaL family protein [Gilliamella sp. B3172]MCX8639003.1 YhcH/YjgK/YiaL family protein [Gilliamella sp. B3172]
MTLFNGFPVSVTTFYPGELHQALCMVDEPRKVRKAVFKVPIDII